MVGNDILKIERGRGFSGLAGVRATTLAGMMKTALRVTMMLALLLAMPSAAQAQSATTTYKVTLKEGTKDADNWKAKAGTGEAKALPLEGVDEGVRGPQARDERAGDEEGALGRRPLEADGQGAGGLRHGDRRDDHHGEAG